MGHYSDFHEAKAAREAAEVRDCTQQQLVRFMASASNEDLTLLAELSEKLVDIRHLRRLGIRV